MQSNLLANAAVDDEDDEMNDPTYEPTESIADFSDISMGTADDQASVAYSHAMTQTSGRRSLWGQTVSTIDPGDSFSVRELPSARRRRIIYAAPSVMSDAPTDHSRSTRVDQPLPAPSEFSYAEATEAREVKYNNLFGRKFGQSDHYMLPVDDDEQLRQNMQHDLLRMHFGSLYASEDLVRHALRRDQETTPTVIDMGCGSGQWVIDMAHEFPWAEVTGMDMAEPFCSQNPSRLPANCKFEIDDANETMGHYANYFSVIHMRSIEAGINDFESFLYKVAGMIRPGGVLLLVSGGPQLYDRNYEPFPVTEPGEPGFTWLQYFLSQTYEAFLHRGTYAVDAFLHWHEWLENNPNYKDVVSRDTYIPLVPWDENATPSELLRCRMKRECVSNILESYRPLLRSDGQTDADIDYWISQSKAELRDLKIRAQVRWRFTTAIRTNEEFQERLETPAPLESPPERLIVAPRRRTTNGSGSLASGSGGSSAGTGGATTKLP